MSEYDYSDYGYGDYTEPTPDYSDYGFGYDDYILNSSNEYSNEGRNYPTPESTQGIGGSPVNAGLALAGQGIPSWLKSLLSKAGGAAASPKGLAALLGAVVGRADKRPPSGGGTTQRFAGPMQMNRTMAQGKYGPIAQYNPQPPVRAAYGGMMQGYAQGGPVQMEHGGFVMTKKAVDGAGGPQGIRGLVPGAAMLRGPGTGTSDSMPAVINGPRGQTPALVSNGEAYVPKQAVQNAGGSEALYALMKQLQRRG